MVKPFEKIDIELLNDSINSSNIELDDVCFSSSGIFDWKYPGGIPIEDQEQIHDTLKRLKQILEDYRDGKLSY